MLVCQDPARQRTSRSVPGRTSRLKDEAWPPRGEVSPENVARALFSTGFGTGQHFRRGAFASRLSGSCCQAISRPVARDAFVRVSSISRFAVSCRGCLPFKIAVTMSGARKASRTRRTLPTVRPSIGRSYASTPFIPSVAICYASGQSQAIPILDILRDISRHPCQRSKNCHPGAIFPSAESHDASEADFASG